MLVLIVGDVVVSRSISVVALVLRGKKVGQVVVVVVVVAIVVGVVVVVLAMTETAGNVLDKTFGGLVDFIVVSTTAAVVTTV